MSKTTIICIDDEEIVLCSLGDQLNRNLGREYDIELVSNGEEALSLCTELKAEKITVALIICDQTMPGMLGDELLIMLHAYYPKALKILLTGQAELNSLSNVINAAALYRYIAKPWEETDLILTVQKALKHHEQEVQLTKQNAVLSQTNQKLAKSLNLLTAVFETADDGILVLDNQGKIVTFNKRFAALWQIDSRLIKGDSDRILSLFLSHLSEPTSCDLKAKKPQESFLNLLNLNNGKILESYFQTQKLEERIVGRVWGFRDVTDREQAKSLAKQKALHDTITQLPKRQILTYQLSEAIAQVKDNSHLLAVMFVELDRFKIISDTLGHRIGDRLLQDVVSRLQECIKEENVIARWGRDEFTLFLPRIFEPKAASAIAQRIIDALKSPFEIEARPVYINSYIGIAIYPEHGTDAETLLKNADTALSQAQKQNNHNYQFYNPILTAQAQKLLTLENLLYSALRRDEFLLYYQPIVNLSTGKIVKMEALLRWNNSQLGFVSPNIFIPLAEENGAIVSIGEWVLKTACAQNKAWQNMGLPFIKVAVNLSVRQFQQPNLVSTIDAILQQTNLSSSSLEIEITETITIQDTEFAKAILEKLHRMGITLSIDDFGTGYSSLSYLRQFPFSTLKIDRSFIKDLVNSPADIAIINAMITLGRGLGLNIVAEGVETIELKELLIDLGCKYIQGYLFSKPLPVDEATKLLYANLADEVEVIAN